MHMQCNSTCRTMAILGINSIGTCYLAGTIAGLGVLPQHASSTLLPLASSVSTPTTTAILSQLAQQLQPLMSTKVADTASDHDKLVASLYLGDGMVPVPDKLLKKIWALEYIEMRDLLPEAWLHDSCSESSHCCHDKSSAKAKRPEVTSIFTWLHCYGTLVSVLAHKYPSKVPEFMAYQSIIVRCYSDYEGDGWLAYDRAFRRKAAYEKSLDWSKLNTSFYQFCLAGNAKSSAVCRICLRHGHKTADCPDQEGSRSRPQAKSRASAKSVEICRLFNASGGSKCHFKNCKFAHLCNLCNRPHSAANCPGSGEPAKRAKQEKTD